LLVLLGVVYAWNPDVEEPGMQRIITFVKWGVAFLVFIWVTNYKDESGEAWE
jgi:hypothetical protein